MEQLPAAMGIIAAQGSDIMLADLVSSIFEEEEQDVAILCKGEAPFISDEL